MEVLKVMNPRFKLVKSEVFMVGGDRDGEKIAEFAFEFQAIHFAVKYLADHEEEFDPVCGSLQIVNHFADGSTSCANWS